MCCIVQVYMELDSSGRLRAVGSEAAALCVRAALAPHVAARGAELELLSPPLLRLRLAAALPPHADLLLWFAPAALAALDMPHLTPRNIRARRDYACHRCGAAFADPNPLKVHLFLDCAPFEPRAFWRLAATRLRAAAPAPAPAPDPAELEALATAWGRSHDGHRCLYCGKLYSRRYGLKIHIRTHTGYRPLRCRYCLRAFGDPSNLNKHVRLHAARTPTPAARYSCPHCGRALARRRDLERHARTHHHSHTHTHTQAREQSNTAVGVSYLL
ncbi:unnamed protein product [Chrysodeixis includens]|uniref:C2H2-type domain-containing protein n=1 Tax=Chrysodeixis includens TaxID=689277 RepID=A0A9N8KRS6_CHRIL|nr:unnamed protein product [Chrysodeixis includens]